MYNFCNLLENDFCNDIVECILTFSVEASNNKKSTVLLFPPLTARGRYLIHKCAETTSFSSLSVGLEPHRRVVVYKRNTSGRNDLAQPRFDLCVSYFNLKMLFRVSWIGFWFVFHVFHWFVWQKYSSIHFNIPGFFLDKIRD